MDILKLARDNESYAIEVRRELHKIPELELELPKTVEFITNELKKLGVEYDLLVNGNAIVATIEAEDSNGPCIGIRADMDALPILEETGLEFASTHVGRMHACGHDGHSAMALTTLKILAENRNIFKGKVKFLFQPGEEIPGGAKPMLDEGALENPRVDYILGLHEGGLVKNMDKGAVYFKEGSMMASMDKFIIKVKGKGGHGANPQDTIDPVVISAEIILAVQKIISREIAPTSSALISICQINGGSSQNIIPDEVVLVGTARTLNEKDRDTVLAQLSQLGVFKNINGIILGTFTEMEKKDYRPSVMEILSKYVGSDMPICKTMEIGHGDSKAIKIGEKIILGE
ncbi:amidohydrolase [Peptoniphilus asaccharolyticus]